MTFIDQIREQCARKGSEPALVLGKRGPDAVSYAQLGQGIDNVCARLLRLNVQPGGLYGVIHADTLVHVTLMLALERLGAATATLKNLGQAASLNLAGIFSDIALPQTEYPAYRADKSWLQDSGGAPMPTSYPPLSPHGLCRIVFTSGSTGRPKAVAVTPHNVALGIANQRYTLGEEFVALNRRLCCPGIDVTYGYRMLMRTLAEGGLYCFVDQNLARNVRSLNFYRVQAVLGSPQQLAFLADYGEQNPGSFTTVEVLVSTGARLPPLLSEKLRRHVCPRLIASYGSSEGGYISAGLAETLDLERGEVGRVIPTVEAEIVDEATHEPVAQGSGLVRFRGEDFVRSYYGEAEGDDPHFEDGWFYPGDIATLSPDRMLTILGRNDNVVNLGGVKTTLETVEAGLSSAPGVKEIAVVSPAGGAERRQVIAFVAMGDGWSEAAFWDYCNTRVSKAMRPAKLVVMADLPKLSSGKIDRQRLTVLVPAS